jgi:hypothetical protein
MTDKNQEQMGFQGSENLRSSENNLDRVLDAALAKYVTVEPRAGLEERVLANLRTEQKRAAEHTWWRWGVVAALAVAIIVAVAIASRPGKPVQEVVGQKPVAPMAPTQSEQKFASNGQGSTVHVQVPTRRAVRHSQVVTAAVKETQPKLDQFPSPQPLSDEEVALARYVKDFPQEAVLIAKSQEEAEMEMRNKMGVTEPLSSEQPER